MKRFSCLLFGLIVGLGFGVQARAATLYASPGSGSYRVGDTITAYIRVNTSGSAINATEGTAQWSTSTLQFVSVSSSGSIFKYWPIDPTVSGASAVIFSGGLPNPGYTGSAGTVIRLTFKAKAAGTGTISMLGGKILANDGQGTDLYTGQSGATYTISTASDPSTPTTPSVPSRPTPVLSSSTHPKQTNWYTNPAVELSWTKSTGSTGFSFELNHNSTTVPDQTIDTTTTSTTIVLNEDGAWYFHLQAKYDSGWSSTAHFALHLDRTPPLPFTPTYDPSSGSGGYGQILASTTDATNAVVRYTYALDDVPTVDGTSVYDLDEILPGEHVVLVTAYDGAGNARTGSLTFTVSGYTVPTVTSVSSPLLLLDPLVVRGRANAGDTITIFINGQDSGHVVVAPGVDVPSDGIVVRFPWTFTSERLYRPGRYIVTVTATSSEGVVSAPTSGHDVRIIGQAMMINGRPVAIWSVVMPVGFLFIFLLVLIIVIMTKLTLATWVMHRHEQLAEDELEALRTVNQQQAISRQQLDQALEVIEEDLDGGHGRRTKKTKNKPKKRSR